ncbi:MAG: F0F1 ATP synthase subunit delta [Vulcanimicrobiaceae bacterium]
MANEKLARRYASAIFALASDGKATEGVGHDLQRVNDAIQSNDDTKRFFVAPVVDAQEKERVLRDTIAGNVHEVALHALLLLVRKRREALLPEIVRQYRILEMRARGAEPLTVTTARALSAPALAKMLSRLEEVYAKKFDVKQDVDPHLIGGARIMMGDRRIDGSVSGRLEDLSRTLFAKN